MKDWRGNEYPEEKLWNSIQEPIDCERCPNQAVRNKCIAEGDSDRTHWHGAIHTREGNIMALCRKCAELDHSDTV